MKKSYSKPMADIEVFSIESIIAMSAVVVNNSPTVVRYTKGRLNF